mmetsp:Transcript_26031/g.60161  ORF Transcript_26031/g.60161 Transcript_26031/m.60161 type:complete len:130 (+) Transcript_26031:83-472(+)
MGFACYARMARCRAAHLSPWARRVNMGLDGHRSLASVSVFRLCSEVRPAGSFPEQRLVACGSEVSVGTSEMDGQECDLVTILKETIERTGASDGMIALSSSYATKWNLGCSSGSLGLSMLPTIPARFRS